MQSIWEQRTKTGQLQNIAGNSSAQLCWTNTMPYYPITIPSFCWVSPNSIKQILDCFVFIITIESEYQRCPSKAELQGENFCSKNYLQYKQNVKKQLYNRHNVKKMHLVVQIPTEVSMSCKPTSTVPLLDHVPSRVPLYYTANTASERKAVFKRIQNCRYSMKTPHSGQHGAFKRNWKVLKQWRDIPFKAELRELG